MTAITWWTLINSRNQISSPKQSSSDFTPIRSNSTPNKSKRANEQSNMTPRATRSGSTQSSSCASTFVTECTSASSPASSTTPSRSTLRQPTTRTRRSTISPSSLRRTFPRAPSSPSTTRTKMTGLSSRRRWPIRRGGWRATALQSACAGRSGAGAISSLSLLVDFPACFPSDFLSVSPSAAVLKARWRPVSCHQPLCARSGPETGSNQCSTHANIAKRSSGDSVKWSLFCMLETYSMTYAAKAETQQSTRRKSNPVKKADRLARLRHADLALIICKNERYYTYRSTDHERWPPTITEIVLINPIHRSWTDSSLESIVPVACQPPIPDSIVKLFFKASLYGAMALIRIITLIESISIFGGPQRGQPRTHSL